MHVCGAPWCPGMQAQRSRHVISASCLHTMLGYAGRVLVPGWELCVHGDRNLYLEHGREGGKGFQGCASPPQEAHGHTRTSARLPRRRYI